MDVKTLSAIIGHVLSAATLNIYTHITGEMQRNAARNIDTEAPYLKIGQRIKVIRCPLLEWKQFMQIVSAQIMYP